MVRYESVRTVLAVAAKHDMELAQFDIKIAFLNSPLEEEIYSNRKGMKMVLIGFVI